MNLNRNDLQEISRIRLNEARILLKAGHYAGAYYLVGYSVECALKACIAKQTRRHDFPDKKLANKAWVHNLENLVELAGLELELEQAMKANKDLELNWALVKDWTEESRYRVSISKQDANDLFSACTARKNGILPWMKKKW